MTGPATSVLSGGMLGEGTTRFDGPLLLEVESDSARLSGGAQVRTNGATELKLGGLDLTAGTWENAGALTITNASPKTTALSGPGVLRNVAGGTITKSGSGALLGSGSLENAGTITVSAGRFGADVPAGTFGTLTQSAGLTKVVAGATLGKAVVLNGGTLSGPGTIRSIVNNGGTVEPGSSPGTLSIAGDYTQGTGGSLRTEITRTAGGAFDVLSVGGTATLAGTLAIASGGFEPAAGETFRILNTRHCVSRRKFRIRLRVPAGVGVTSATVTVDGRRVKVVRGRRLRAPVDLRRLPRGRFKVAITVRLADGRSLRGTRSYRTCAKGRHPHR